MNHIEDILACRYLEVQSAFVVLYNAQAHFDSLGLGSLFENL